MAARLTAAFAQLALLALIPLATGCASDEGGACALDSDCSAGLACSREGQCITFEGLLESFTIKPPPTSKPDADAGPTDDVAPVDVVEVDADGCLAPRGIFAASTGTCEAPDEKLAVANIIITPTGHGGAGLAAVGNPILEDQFANKEIALELWVDGSLDPGCPAELRWLRSPDEQQADCTIVHGDTVPVEIRGILTLFVIDPEFDPKTGVLNGLLDKAAILAALDPAIRDVADKFIVLNVDTDSDGTPDTANVEITVIFE